MNGTRAVERVVVMEGDTRVASQVGLHLLGQLADRSGLTSGYSAAVPWAGQTCPCPDRGRLLAQVAVMLADGGDAKCADMAALRDQPELFGEVASAPTVWRALQAIDAPCWVLDASWPGSLMRRQQSERLRELRSEMLAIAKVGGGSYCSRLRRKRSNLGLPA